MTCDHVLKERLDEGPFVDLNAVVELKNALIGLMDSATCVVVCQNLVVAVVPQGKRHARLDAYLAAWVAALPEDQREALGLPPNDAIWIPRLDRRERFGRNPHTGVVY